MTYFDIISDSNPHEKHNKRLQNFLNQIGYDLTCIIFLNCYSSFYLKRLSIGAIGKNTLKSLFRYISESFDTFL